MKMFSNIWRHRCANNSNRLHWGDFSIFKSKVDVEVLNIKKYLTILNILGTCGRKYLMKPNKWPRHGFQNEEENIYVDTGWKERGPNELSYLTLSYLIDVVSLIFSHFRSTSTRQKKWKLVGQQETFLIIYCWYFWFFVHQITCHFHMWT